MRLLLESQLEKKNPVTNDLFHISRQKTLSKELLTPNYAVFDCRINFCPSSGGTSMQSACETIPRYCGALHCGLYCLWGAPHRAAGGGRGAASGHLQAQRQVTPVLPLSSCRSCG